jgi:uncharacterized protein
MSSAEFQWDNGNWPKCGRHGLTQAQIESVFRREFRVFPDKAKALSESRLNAVGTPPEGRYVFVVFVLRQSEDITTIRPISARYMHAKEVRRYEQQTKT